MVAIHFKTVHTDDQCFGGSYLYCFRCDLSHHHEIGHDEHHGGDGPADGIGRHDGVKRSGERKHGIHPDDPHTADPCQ